MNGRTNVRLKSTNESVVILVEDGADPRHGPARTGYRLCQLPPQSPGHKPRLQWIRGQRLLGSG
ncbi:MAG: hypothetical protein JJU31_09540 [Wenzhouxiangella sp.]|nr:hypothetical protein [Wenzhouxiangella sp.]